MDEDEEGDEEGEEEKDGDATMTRMMTMELMTAMREK